MAQGSYDNRLRPRPRSPVSTDLPRRRYIPLASPALFPSSAVSQNPKKNSCSVNFRGDSVGASSGKGLVRLID
jgi:hypothetical protein